LQAVAHLELPAGCTEAQPASCAYQPSATWNDGSVDLLLEDPARDDHPVPFRLRYPIGADGPLPVVVWNHGGGTTRWASRRRGAVPVSAGQGSSEEHGRSFARRGYVVIHIGRLPAESLTAAQQQDCVAAGVIARPAAFARLCREFIGYRIYGPQNVAFVLAELERLQQTLPDELPVSLDLSRVVVGGWSGGSAIPLAIAGAIQQHRNLRIDPLPVPGVIGFLASSPRGPEWGSFSSGFVDDFDATPELHGLYGVDQRPFLFLTGRHDLGKERDAIPLSRPTAFWDAQRGGKYLSWAWQDGGPGRPVHGTYDLGECGGPRAAYCGWFDSLGIAYLDAVVRERPEAIAWLASDAYRVLTGGLVDLHRR